MPMPLRPPISLASIMASRGVTSLPLIWTGRPLEKRMATCSGLSGACQGQTPMVGSTMVMEVSMLSRSSASWERPAMLASVEYFFLPPAKATMPNWAR